VIKDDNTIVSGHRRWLALKELGIKAQCRVMTFNDELDEKESLIEFNKQRVKNASQFFNEDKTLREIYSIRARDRRLATLKQNVDVKDTVPLNLAERVKEKGDTRDKVADAIGINRNKLDTIREIGELSESGKSVAEKAKEEKETEKAESIAFEKQKIVVIDDEDETESIKVHDAKVITPEVKKAEVAPIDKVTELKKEVAKEVMKKLDDESISINGARQLAKVIQSSPEVAKKAIDMVVAKPNMSVEKALTDVRREMKREEIKTTIPNTVTNGLYDIILCDPPWRYEHVKTNSRAIENQYPTMSLDEIKALNVPAEENCILYMWATSPKLKEAMEVIEAWGFDYRSSAVWDKEKIGMGYWFRGQHELLLVAVKGKPSTPPEDKRYSSVIRSCRTEHSKKPEIVYEMIESMFPYKKRIEMFARNTRYGWESWGNQVNIDSQISDVPCTNSS